jgi:hypothetical protein
VDVFSGVATAAAAEALMVGMRLVASDERACLGCCCFWGGEKGRGRLRGRGFCFLAPARACPSLSSGAGGLDGLPSTHARTRPAVAARQPSRYAARDEQRRGREMCRTEQRRTWAS